MPTIKRVTYFYLQNMWILFCFPFLNHTAFQNYQQNEKRKMKLHTSKGIQLTDPSDNFDECEPRKLFNSFLEKLV